MTNLAEEHPDVVQRLLKLRDEYSSGDWPTGK